MFGSKVLEKSEHPGLREASHRASQIISDAIANCQRLGLEGGDTDGLATLIVDGQLSKLLDSGADLEALANSLTDVIYRVLSFSELLPNLSVCRCAPCGRAPVQ